MNEQQTRERFHRAIDTTLSGVAGNDFLYARVTAKAAQEQKGAKNMKLNKIFAIALVILLCITAAAASELLSGTVNWDGTLTPDEPKQPAAVPTPTAPVIAANAERNALEAAFEEANLPQDGEYVLFYDTHAEVPLIGWNRIRCSVDSLDELAAAVGDALALPVNIPEGCVFYEGTVLYGCRPEGNFNLTETVESEDGFRAEKYTLNEADQVVIGYELDLRQAGYENPMDAPYVAVYAWLGNWEHDGPAMHLLDVVSTRAANVPGMEKAVAAQGVNVSHLEMYANLKQSVTFRSDVLEEAETFFTADYSVYGTVNADALLAMFGGK